MSDKPYPLFIPPGDLVYKTFKEYTGKEAKAFFQWFLSIMDQRINDMLVYFDEELAGNTEDDLKRLGKRVAEIIRSPQFSGMRERAPIIFKHKSGDRVLPAAMELTLTGAGISLAYDMGLLISKFILDECGPSVKWIIEKGGKTNVSYQCPVLKGLGEATFDPRLISSSMVYGVLRGNRSSEVWFEMFTIWKKNLLTEKSL